MVLGAVLKRVLGNLLLHVRRNIYWQFMTHSQLQLLFSASGVCMSLESW
jgi:hypothetical protein